MSQTLIDQLNKHHALPEVARFELGQGDLPCLQVQSPLAQATLYAHGAHLTHYQPAGQQPVLWLSQQSLFQPDKPIRGGIPLCFPWFGPRANHPDSPLHGFARIYNWKLRSLTQLPSGAVQATYALGWTPRTLEAWPGAFEFTYTLTFGSDLHLEARITNHGQQPMPFELALHTYLTVGDVTQIAITGLQGTTYIDKTDAMHRHEQATQELRITGETDRVYLGTPGTVTVHDPVLRRRLVIEKTGSQATVVWNPWIEKAKRMADFGDDEWRGMLCIETACVADHAITLAPGQEHTLTATIRCEPA